MMFEISASYTSRVTAQIHVTNLTILVCYHILSH